MADDLEVDLERMASWTEKMAISYFESGEEPTPPDTALVELLEGAELSHLIDVTHGQTLAEWLKVFRTERSKFLPMLKALGVEKLPERQKIRDAVLARVGDGRRPRALCLHGRCTNGKFFVTLLSNFVRPLADACELLPLDGLEDVPEHTKERTYVELIMARERHGGVGVGVG